MNEKLGKRIFKYSLIFSLYIFILELLVRFNTGNSFIDWATLRIFISSILLGTILGFLVSLFKKNKIFVTILSFLIVVYTWVQINLFTYLGFFMGLGNAEQGTKTTDYIKDYLMASKWQSYLVIIPFALLMFYIWYLNRKFKLKKLEKTTYFVFKKELKLEKILAILSMCLVLIISSILYFISLRVSFMQNKLQSVKNTDLILSSDNSNLSVSQFGVLMYGASDVFINIFDIDIDTDYIEEIKKEETVINDKTRVIDDTAWKSVIENETNSTYNKLNNYFINREITPKNDYTGIFKDKNLIVILMESTNEIVINEKEYPTLYKMYNEGFSFRNNYSPRNNCSTGNNEMTVMTGLFTINNTCTANTYKNNKYFEAIFNVFNDASYYTSSYHDYAEYYYARRTIHPNMGSQKYMNASDLGIKWSSIYEQWPSDTALVETSFDEYINNEHFMTFLTSVTAHQPYTVSSEMGDLHLDEFSDYDYSTPVKRYMSKLKEFDAALELLLQKLEEAGKLDDTVIALFGDHYPYGLTTSQINSVLDYDVTVNNEVDRTPLIIYNAATPGIQVDKYTSILDLLPTLLNMFDLNYDPRLYMGHDIFSEYDDRTVFADGSWQDSVGYYSATKSKFIPKDENVESYTDEELIKINNEINLRQKMSANAIKNDYFNYLDKKINKYLESQKIEEEVPEEEING